jgi:imidazolonepropionase
MICIYILERNGNGKVMAGAGEESSKRTRIWRNARLATMSAALPGLGVVDDGAVVSSEGRIVFAGPTVQLPAALMRDAEIIDCGGRWITPGLIDCHTHLVHAGNRANEFEMRLAGATYEEVARAGGGIVSSVKALRAASEDDLVRETLPRLDALIAEGVATVEIKSGYGLNVEDEARSLRLAREVTDETTFLGAHVVPAEYAEDPAGYVDLVTGPMLEAAAPYARWIDAFCERGAFDADQAREVLTAGAAAGLRGRLHANQLGPGPGVRLAAELGLTAVDHCTYLGDEDVDALRDSGTIATLLPGVEFSTRQPYPDARRLIDAGVRVAIASDCNPGSCFTSSMPFCVALAVREMRMTPAEAVHAATAGGAAALDRTDVGRIVPGSRADLVLLRAPSHVHLAYRPGVPLVDEVWVAA